jgi:crossover junction endodeoxyribonuclease RuvC
MHGAEPRRQVIVLGVDPGSIRLGYGVVRTVGQRLHYLDCGVISAPAGWSLERRLAEIGQGLEDAVSEAVEAADPGELCLAAIEAGYAEGPGVLALSAARGVAMFILYRQLGVEIRAYAPSTVKLAATGHGNADKSLVSRMVKLRLGMKTEPGPDEGDALAIAICRACEP